MQITVLQHEPVAGPGLLSEFVRFRGWPTERVLLPQAFERLDVDSLDGEAVVILGSPYSVEDTEMSWITAERGIVRQLLQQRVPVFGICFGAQLLAAEGGGAVRRLPTRRIGWREVPGAGALWRGPWFRWHDEQCLLPPRVEPLASEGGIPEVFTLPAAFGVQFHPEVCADTLRAWGTVAHFDDPARRAALDQAIDYAQSNAAVVRARAFALFERVFSTLAQRQR